MTHSHALDYLITFFLRLSGISLLSLLLVGSAAAQSSSWSATTGTTPTSMSPGAPAGSYSLSDFETVNLFNRRMSFGLPLVHIGGRGTAGFTVQLPIGNQWTEYHYSYPGNCGQGGCGPPVETTIPIPNDWKYLPTFSPGVMAGRSAVETPIASCGSWSAYAATLTRLTFSAADGTEYEFRDDLYDGQPRPSTCQTTTNRGHVFHTSDGTAATFISDSDIYDPAEPNSTILSPSGYLMFRDGTRYRIDSGNVSWLRDSNGNQLTFGYTNGQPTTITDSLERRVTLTITSSYKEIAFAGVGGSVTRYIRVYNDSLSNLLISGTVQTYGGSLGLFPYLPNASTSSTYNPSIASRVVLPDGRQYSFKYNTYGEMVRIDLPTGGRIEYDYAQPENQSVHHYVTERRVFTVADDLSTLEGKTRYDEGTVDQLTAAGILLSREKHYFYGGPYNEDLFGNHPTHYSGWNQGREWKTEAYAADGTTLLRSVMRTWQQRAPVGWWSSGYGPEPPNNPRLVETVTTLADTNQVTKTTAINPQPPYNVGFDQFNNATDSWEYDYGNGAPSAYPLRHTHTDYLTTNPANNIDYTLYTGAHIRSLGSAQKVYSVSQSDGSETLVAQNTTSYDETNSYPVLTYGSVTGWTDPGIAARGNATTSSHWLNTNNSWLATHAQYDQVGNVRSVWDAKGNQTQVSYVDSFSDSINRNTYALATGMTSPVPDPTGVYGLTTSLSVSTVYDFSTGAVISGTDANGQTASFQYNDLLDRPTQLRRAVNTTLTNQTTVIYDDTNHTITTTSDQTTSNDNALKGQIIYDGLGRTIETRSYENSSQYITVKMIPYVPLQDPDTGVWVGATQSSNPYRSYLGEQPVWTTSFSDALGRTIKVRTPDNAIAGTYYDGARVLVKDQTGKERLTKTNALGQLKDVWEVTAPDPPNTEAISFPGRSEVTAGYRTSYAYDALNNLLTVTQGSQTRLSLYDSLKRMYATTTPENGMVSFQYDDNGNVTQRTDARQPAVTTTYVYDHINRPITRTYSGGTPGVTYKYDSASGVSNAKGRVVSVSSSVSTYSYGGYDELGRINGGSQTLDSQTYLMSYTYDLAGHVLSETYPSGHKFFNSYDGAGRLSSVTGTLGDNTNTNRTYSTGIVYSALGGMAKEQFGTDAPVFNKLFYNVRGQLAEIRESTSYTDPNDTDSNRGAIINNYSDQCTGRCGGSNSTTSMTDNNGNLKNQNVEIPISDGGISATWRDGFTYDNLNRLTQVNEYTGNSSFDWHQKYILDRYGNRTIDYNNTSTNIPRPQFNVDTNTNRLTVPNGYTGTMTYDNAGNLINDTYSVQGQGQRDYDAENRMTRVWSNGQWQTYTYDAGGQRVKRNVDGYETWQVYGIGGELLAEYEQQHPSPLSPQKEYGYRNGQLLVTAEAPAASAINVALAANGATASASSAYPGFAASGINNGDRKGLGVGQDGYWSSATSGFSNVSLVVDFHADKTISEIDVFTLQDNYNAPVEPTDATTFSLYGLTGYEVQYLDGTNWVTVPVVGNVMGNNKVWRKFSFAAVTTRSIRVLPHASGDGWSRVTELEAWTGASPATLSPNNFALNSNGATANASSAYPGYLASGTNNGDRKGVGGGQNGYWSTASSGFPASLEVVFPAEKSIGEVDVFTIQDNFAHPSEPTEAMTFSLYGLTEFEVQYWNGSDWVTVTGGSVTGNNKVWRKFTFTAITTNKIRVLTHASTDGYSRLTEVEAWSPAASGGTTPNIEWVVTDHLGTPRLVFDKTGSVASTKRHDYLPFGEELTSQGLRDPAHGYGGGDGVRQKYTSYERDDETGLDYAHARYYGNVQGRFTSPDPFSGSATIADPQTFNRYAYVGNNPVTLSDPTGMFVESNTNPHSANTFFSSVDDSVGSQIPGHGNRNQFVHEAIPAAGTTGIAAGLIPGAGAGAAPQNPAPQQQPDPCATQVLTRFNLTDSSDGNPPIIPYVQSAIAQDFLDALLEINRAVPGGIGFTEVFRTRAHQQELWDNRGNNPNPVAHPGTSRHEGGFAFDVPGMATRDRNRHLVQTPLGRTVIPIFADHGFAWGGAFNDPPHFQADPTLHGYANSAAAATAANDYYGRCIAGR